MPPPNTSRTALPYNPPPKPFLPHFAVFVRHLGWLQYKCPPSKDMLGTQPAHKRVNFGYVSQILKPNAATCDTHSRPPPLSFLLKLYVIVLHTHGYRTRKFWPNPKHQDGILNFVVINSDEGDHLQHSSMLSTPLNAVFAPLACMAHVLG